MYWHQNYKKVTLDERWFTHLFDYDKAQFLKYISNKNIIEKKIIYEFHQNPFFRLFCFLIITYLKIINSTS